MAVYSPAYTGADEAWVVPAGVTSVTIDAKGAGGGSPPTGPARGGAGGRAQCTITVTPGETLTLRVAGTGTWPGAGNVPVSRVTHGGGYTGVFRGSTPLCIAAGGGGGGYNNTSTWIGNAGSGGAGGGATGNDGIQNDTSNAQTTMGHGGTQSAGGAGGTGGGGAAGTSLQGGTSSGDGGGGGGGYFGGGSGGDYGGGGGGAGGGSSFTSGTNQSTTTGGGGAAGAAGSAGSAGSLTLTYNRPPTAPTVTAPNGGEVINASINITWTAGTDPDGDALTYDIDYSANNGGAWTNVAVGVSGTLYAWNTAALAAGAAYLVRVRAKDPSGATSAYDQSNAVFTIQHNAAPNPATWVSPANNSTLDRSVAQTLTFQFNDPDVGDVLTKFDYRYRLVGAATWTTTGTVTGSTPGLTIAANALAAGTYEFQVLTYDGQGLAATGWSASLQEIFADAPAAPAVTTPASGSVVSTATGTAAWTVGTQTDFQVQRVADNAGVINTATVYQDTGIITSTTARNVALNFETNNRYEWIRVRIRNNGLWSAWSSVRYQVSYTPPANPSGITFVFPATDPDTIQVNITNPNPAGGQPAISKIELHRRARTDVDGNVVTGPDAYSIRVANVSPSAGGVTTVIDYTPASGVQYEYQAVILGVNGTWSYSPWVS